MLYTLFLGKRPSMKFNQLATTVALSSIAALSHAAPIWQDFSLTGLYGKNYALPDNMDDNNNQSTITAEYTAKLVEQLITSYGDKLHLFAGRNPKYAHLLDSADDTVQ